MLSEKKGKKSNRTDTTSEMAGVLVGNGRIEREERKAAFLAVRRSLGPGTGYDSPLISGLLYGDHTLKKVLLFMSLLAVA